MTYNVFSGTLNATQSIDQSSVPAGYVPSFGGRLHTAPVNARSRTPVPSAANALLEDLRAVMADPAEFRKRLKMHHFTSDFNAQPPVVNTEN